MTDAEEIEVRDSNELKKNFVDVEGLKESNETKSKIKKQSIGIIVVTASVLVILIIATVLVVKLKKKKDEDDGPDEPDDGKYFYEKNPGLTSSFGCEGDRYAPIAFIDGSYKLRDRGDAMITFGVTGILSKVKWYNKDGYLPCFVSEYKKNKLKITVENFSFEHKVNDHRFQIAYSRMTIKNEGKRERVLPKVSSILIPLNNDAKTKVNITSGQTIIRDYAVGADRFDGKYDYPTDEEIAKLGSFDENYNLMKKYWNERLSELGEIEEFPNKQLINAYKAGFIYTHIVRDDVIRPDGTVVKEIHVGENGYKEMYDHDTIGIVSGLFTVGDFKYAKEYLRNLPAQLQYDDAKWKFTMPFAIYLQKTGDYQFMEECFDSLKTQTHKVETDRDPEMGNIIKKTNAIDSNGYWLVDDWSALTGLTTYKHICNVLYAKTKNETYLNESKWSQNLYDDLLSCVEKKQKEVRDKNDYPYISIDMVKTTEQGPRADPKDGNWASMFLFGRWSWEGYLFGANQNTSEMIKLIDATYEHGFERRKKYGEEHNDSNVGDTIYNFGGYPHGYYSSTYNAGYGAAGLRGEKYRDQSIKSYEFMLNKSMSGPFSWWEGVNWPSNSSPWDHDHAQGGGGSCPHMWGQSFASKSFFDSLIAEKVEEKIIIGRGVAKEWISNGKRIKVKNISCDLGKKTGYLMERKDKKISVEFSGDKLSIPYSIELMILKNNIDSVVVDESGKPVSIDNEKGIVVIAPGAKKVVIQLKN